MRYSFFRSFIGVGIHAAYYSKQLELIMTSYDKLEQVGSGLINLKIYTGWREQ